MSLSRPKPAPAPLLVSVAPVSLRPKEAARALGVGHSHFYKLLKSGKIPFRKDGWATLIDPQALIEYRDSLPVIVASDLTPTGPLLPNDQQRIALQRAHGVEATPRRTKIDLADIYEGRRRLLVPEIGPVEARRGAYEFTVQAYARHFDVELDEAGERTLAALAECGWLEPNPNPSSESSDDEVVA